MNSEYQLEPFKITAYDHVDEIATITYMGGQGQFKSIAIHRKTFNDLMDPYLDRESKESLKITGAQSELRACLNSNSKEIKNWAQWFEKTTNDIMKINTNRKAR